MSSLHGESELFLLSIGYPTRASDVRDMSTHVCFFDTTGPRIRSESVRLSISRNVVGKEDEEKVHARPSPLTNW